MKKGQAIERISTGVRGLDSLLNGGLPKYAVTVIAGTPGAGKTTFSQQICFHNATPESKAIFFQTLSEPGVKTIKYMSEFEFFDSVKFGECVEFVDLGAILRSDGLADAIKMMTDHIKRVKPSLVVIDSFKVFEDLAESAAELRKFVYEIAVQLMAWEITAFLIGEYAASSIENSPLFSVVDGIITMRSQDSDTESERQRVMKIIKMRGTNHSRTDHPYLIDERGIEIFCARSRVAGTVMQENAGDLRRLQSGISGLDAICGGGFMYPSLNLISGETGSGKTLFILESIYRGAKDFQEKGLIFSFELTEAQLFGIANSMGWDLSALVKTGMIEILHIPQPEILIEKNLEMILDHIEIFKPNRVAIDSLGVFLEKIQRPDLYREKVLLLSSIIKNAGAVGFLTMDTRSIAPEMNQNFSSQSVADGIVLLSSKLNGLEREHSIEILKLRNTTHSRRQHRLLIQNGGLAIQPQGSESATSKKTEPKK